MEKQQAYWNSRPEIKGCIYMTGPDLRFGDSSERMNYVVKKDGQRSGYIKVR